MKVDAEGHATLPDARLADIYVAMQPKVGACLDEVDVKVSPNGLSTKLCSSAHDDEAFFAFEATGFAGYPTAAELAALTTLHCEPALWDYLKSSAAETRLSFRYAYSSEHAWKGGARTIVCLAFDPEKKLSGSVKGKGATYPSTVDGLPAKP